MSFCQHVVICHEGGTDLLVTVLCKLVQESCRGVDTCIKSSLYFKFVVDKQVNIFLDGLLVDDAVGIVFVIGILKL